MPAVIKSLIVAVLGLLFAVVLGFQLGQSDWTAPVAVAGACILLALYVMFFRTVRLEALILGLLFFGYIVGNRGFAQLSLGGSTPLFLGEVGMVLCLFFIAFRLTLSREKPIEKGPLVLATGAFLVLGGIRLYLDVFLNMSGAPTLMAIRDSAAVYYALFFFIGYQTVRSPSSRRFLVAALHTAGLLLLPVIIVQLLYPSLLFQLTIRGVPLIYQKGDLLVGFAECAAFYFFLVPARGIPKVFYRALSAIYASSILLLFSRAVFVGVCLATLLLIAAKRPGFLIYQVGLASLALVAAVLIQLGGIRFETGLTAKAFDKVTSITDISGSRSYRSEYGANAADNNQFRLVWWRSVFNETMSKNPWFGLGFGYDLAGGFLRDYYQNRGRDFTTRSPHSIWFTMLGRMGVIGVLSFGVVVFFMLREAFRAARRVSQGRAGPASLILWCALLILLGSGSFGVVLEGPMGGILFWSFLGWAYYDSISLSKKVEPASAVTAPPPTRRRQLQPI